jgi:type I restriction enzyme, S subunit
VELKPGYKQTELGVIPQQWEIAQLGNIGQIKTGPFGTLLKADEYSGRNGTPLISVREVGQGILRVDEGTPLVPPSVVRRLPEYVLRAGDIVFGRKGAVDRSALVNESQGGWFLGSDGIRFRPTVACHPPYIAYQLQRQQVQSWLLQNATGTTMPSMNQEILCRVSLPLAPPLEQRAIAEALSNVDALIGALDQLIAKKRDLKRAAMQQFLTGNQRLPGFTGHWKVKPLGEIAELKNGYAFRSATYTDLGEFNIITIANVQDGYMDNTECNKVASIPMDIQPHHKLRRGDILISMTGNVGRVCRVNEDNCLLNQRVGKIVSTAVEDGLLFFLLSQRPFIVAMMGKAKGGAQGNLSVTDITTHQFHVPSDPGEQIAIAEVLSDMDAELVALEQRRDKTRALKQGMMQELLTGRTRLV